MTYQPSRRCQCLVTVLFAALMLAPDSSAGDDTIDGTRRNAVVRAVERVQPAVVSIHVVHRERILYRYQDPFLEQFFRGSPFGQRYYSTERDRVSGGSGFLIDSGGTVLTNAHVLGQGQIVRVEVSLPDGRIFEARASHKDESVDLAVLQIDGEGLPVAPLSQSGDILVGEWAIAIGNPFDLGPTVSIGVISAIDRDFPERQGDFFYRDMIQTDAAINPGNSGGPLVNALGEVVGINSFIYTGGEYSLGSIGIGFAVPVDAARRFIDEIRTHGRVRIPWHGIADLQDLTPRLADYLELDGTDGAVVVRVNMDSPADQAGLGRGDVILAVNGESVTSAMEAWSLLQGLRVEQECEFEVVRRGKRQTLELRVAERPVGPSWN
ncbi:MAG: trypsin-like peptidase domain-containing protein [bacterium]|nr:trypsin-like peptidase domain-containing protein [bacterium]